MEEKWTDKPRGQEKSKSKVSFNYEMDKKKKKLPRFLEPNW